MCDFSKASETEKYFEKILNKIGDSKITCIYSRLSTWSNNGYFTYMQDNPLYIIFDNGNCLVIEYYEINKLFVEYRKMTQDELGAYDKSDKKDLFNRTTNIHDYRSGKIIRIEKSELSYEGLERIELKHVTEEYSAWIEGDIEDGIKPTEETFNEIKFVMKNGKSFTVCADDAESDGYSLIWSEDADMSENIV